MQTDEVFDWIEREKLRQSEGLELIPSENYVSENVLRAMGSILTNKYSEGYPGKRYYGGNENIDEIERLAIERAKQLFSADHANVQPHSGANANEAVYFAWCQPGDTILAMSLPAGGHLTHGSPVTRSAKIYNFVGYGVTEDGDIDYNELERLAYQHHPQLILVGYSAFMKIPDFDRIHEIAQAVSQETGQEILLMADMAHVAGLIAGNVHPNPLQHGFQVMTTTTHKTLRGPRGGLILSMGKVGNPLKKTARSLKNIPTLIDRAVFPGTQGGPLEHIIAAKAVAFQEDLQPDFHDYAQDIVANAKALAAELQNLGFKLQGNGTDNHLILVDIKASFGIDGKLYETALDQIGLTLNANSLPHDQGAAFRPSGVRLGTPAITTRGFGLPEMKQIANWMKQVADLCAKAQSSADDSNDSTSILKSLASKQEALDQLRSEVREVALRFPVPGVC